MPSLEGLAAWRPCCGEPLACRTAPLHTLHPQPSPPRGPNPTSLSPGQCQGQTVTKAARLWQLWHQVAPGPHALDTHSGQKLSHALAWELPWGPAPYQGQVTVLALLLHGRVLGQVDQVGADGLWVSLHVDGLGKEGCVTPWC